MSRIDNIYNTFVNTENYKELPKTQEAERQIYEYLKRQGIKEIDFDVYVTSVAGENMRQGFIYGFRYAVDLLVGREVPTV